MNVVRRVPMAWIVGFGHGLKPERPKNINNKLDAAATGAGRASGGKLFGGKDFFYGGHAAVPVDDGGSYEKNANGIQVRTGGGSGGGGGDDDDDEEEEDVEVVDIFGDDDEYDEYDDDDDEGGGEGHGGAGEHGAASKKLSVGAKGGGFGSNSKRAQAATILGRWGDDLAPELEPERLRAHGELGKDDDDPMQRVPHQIKPPNQVQRDTAGRAKLAGLNDLAVDVCASVDLDIRLEWGHMLLVGSIDDGYSSSSLGETILTQHNRHL